MTQQIVATLAALWLLYYFIKAIVLNRKCFDKWGRYTGHPFRF